MCLLCLPTCVYDRQGAAFISRSYSDVYLSGLEWPSSQDPLVSLRLDPIVCLCMCLCVSVSVWGRERGSIVKRWVRGSVFTALSVALATEWLSSLSSVLSIIIYWQHTHINARTRTHTASLYQSAVYSKPFYAQHFCTFVLQPLIKVLCTFGWLPPRGLWGCVNAGACESGGVLFLRTYHFCLNVLLIAKFVTSEFWASFHQWPQTSKAEDIILPLACWNMQRQCCSVAGLTYDRWQGNGEGSRITWSS